MATFTRRFAAAVLLLLVARSGAGLVQRTAVIVDAPTLPAIDEGLLLSASRGPAAPAGPPRTVRSLRIPRSAFDRAGASGAPYAAGRIIVKFKSRADFDVLPIDADLDPEEMAGGLASRSDIAYAQPAYRYHPQFVPDDPLYNRQWNLPQMNLEQAWNIQPGASPSIVVAVLDTGVAYTDVTVRYTANAFGYNGELYPALGELTLPFAAAPELGAAGRFVAPRDFIWNSTLPLDLDGHGTHVAGTIGQLTNNGRGTAGVAFNVSLMPVKVLSSTWDDVFGSPGIGTDETVARGIRYAADNGAKVINMSIGRTGPPAPVVEDAMRYAVGKGAFIAVAAGNGHEAGNPTEVLAEIASRLAGAVAVGAVDRRHDRAFYSTTGPHVEVVAPGGSFRDGGAEGGILQQTLDLSLVETFTLPLARFTAPRFDTVAYIYFTGTSQATPHVSGLAALLMRQGITDPAAVEAAIERFAVDRGAPGRDDEYGYGEVDARATLRGLGLAR